VTDRDAPRTRAGGMLLLGLLHQYGWRVRVRKSGAPVGIAERDGLRVVVRGRSLAEVIVRLYTEALSASSGRRAAQAA
jgi:hypothetical protein